MLRQLLIATAVLTSAYLTAGESQSLRFRIRDENPETRSQAIHDLHKRLVRGHADAETIEAFVLTGFETDHVLRMEAHGLASLIKAAAVPHLQSFLSDTRAPVRARAANGLGAVGPLAMTSLAALLNALRSDEDTVAAAAGAAIGSIDQSAKSFPELLEMLRGSDRTRRLRSLHALEGFDDRVRPIVAELLTLVRKGDETERYWSVNVIANTKFSEPSVVRAVVDLLEEDPSAFVRERCARELWELAEAQKPIPGFAADALVRAASSDPEERVKEEARKALSSSRQRSK